MFCTVTMSFVLNQTGAIGQSFLKFTTVYLCFSLKLLLSEFKHLFIQQVYFAKNVPYIYICCFVKKDGVSYFL